MIRAEGVTKRYGDRTALADVDLEVPPGSITGLLGPNGAGKSTLLKLCCGLARADAGALRVLGEEPARRSPALLRRLALVPEDKQLPGSISVGGFVRWYLAFYPDADPRAAEKRIRAWGIEPATATDRLSPGLRNRVLQACVLAREPELTLLDQPAEGLDPRSVEELAAALTARAGSGGTTWVLATHRLDVIERICDRVAVLDDGRLRTAERLDALRERWRRVTMADPELSADEVTGWPGVCRAERGARGLEVVVDDHAALERELSDRGRAPARADHMNLREIYLELLRSDRGFTA